MSAVVAAPTPLAPSPSIAPPSVSASAEPAPKRSRTNLSPDHSDRVFLGTTKSSPLATRSGPPPPVLVKKEPGSPALASSRPRPKRLDLSTSSLPSGRGPQTARPLTSRESAGLAIQDVGLACLSPGFQTNDPSMREQLQRSMDVRDQQRQIIEARQKGTKPGALLDSAEASSSRAPDNNLFGVPTSTRPLNTSRRKGPPPMLSINAPSAAAFANDRVIQSAPLHQTFTGLQPGEFPRSRHVQHGPSNLSQTSHIHHAPANQTNNRLPPISDVFANDRLDAPRPYGATGSPSQSAQAPAPPPAASPGFPPSSAHNNGSAYGARPREFRSAEEAVHGLSGGRDDLMPKVLHYGGVQPPTPPSPVPGAATANGLGHHASSHHHLAAAHSTPHHSYHASSADPAHDEIRNRNVSIGRRRARDEYERDNGSSPPPPPSFLGPPSFFPRPDHHKRGPASRDEDRDREDDWRAGMSSAEKREEFLRLCERAWDLFHS